MNKYFSKYLFIRDVYLKEDIILKYYQTVQKMLDSSDYLMYSTPKFAVPFINNFERRLMDEQAGAD